MMSVYMLLVSVCVLLLEVEHAATGMICVLEKLEKPTATSQHAAAPTLSNIDHSLLQLQCQLAKTHLPHA